MKPYKPLKYQYGVYFAKNTEKIRASEFYLIEPKPHKVGII